MKSELTRVLLPFAITAAVSIALFAIRKIALRQMGKYVKKTEGQLDDLVLKALSVPSIYWCLAIGIYIGVTFSELPDKHVHYIGKAINVLILLSVTFAAANLAGIMINSFMHKISLNVPATGIAFGVIKGTIIVIGILVILNTIGISVTPLITALGVGGLAVALALKDTLANLFSGIQILMEKSIRIGDFIRLESGQEGYVEDITWRTARIRMLPNNMAIIPNSILSQSVITNYNLPEKRMSLPIPISVSYSSDPEKVERVLIEETRKAIGVIPGLLGVPEPLVRFMPGFGDSSLDFTLICQIEQYSDQYIAQHELRKRILRRFQEENIEIPFPHRVVIMDRERVANEKA
ncbi:MAG: Low conductance mechanosensitive channel YnaI [bacterium ADurb.Bin236]|nr:MAG: Low conductance mechanosensitive channel YnaI [bacterium ADurb.Bin236]